MYLIEDSHDKVFASLLLLTDGSESHSFLPKEFTSTGSHAASVPAQTPPPAPAPAPAPVRSQPVPSPAPAPVQPVRSAQPPSSSSASSSSSSSSAVTGGSGVRVLSISVTKGPHGIGLDLVKTANGRASIQRLKEMPEGVPNPAAHCSPPFRSGDVIIGVNGQSCGAFSDTIKMIRAIEGLVTLQIERQG